MDSAFKDHLSHYTCSWGSNRSPRHYFLSFSSEIQPLCPDRKARRYFLGLRQWTCDHKMRKQRDSPLWFGCVDGICSQGFYCLSYSSAWWPQAVNLASLNLYFFRLWSGCTHNAQGYFKYRRDWEWVTQLWERPRALCVREVTQSLWADFP